MLCFQCKYYALSGLKSIKMDYRLYHLPMSPFNFVQNKSRFPAPKAYYATSHTGKLYNLYDEPKAEVFLLSMCKSFKKSLPYEAVIQAESLCIVHCEAECVLNDKVILPKRWRGLPKQTQRGVVLPEAGAACSALWRMLAVTAQSSNSLTVSIFSQRMNVGQE